MSRLIFSFATLITLTTLIGCTVDDEILVDDVEQMSAEIHSVRGVLCDESRMILVNEPSGRPFQIVSCGPVDGDPHQICNDLRVVIDGSLSVHSGSYYFGARVMGAWSDDVFGACIVDVPFVSSPDVVPWRIRAVPTL